MKKRLNEEQLHRLIRQVKGASSDYDLAPDLRPTGRALRPAAVLIAVVPHENGPRVILTKRSAQLRNHPGQVAFPGGRIDPEDVCAQAAALREAEEEIALPRSIVRVLGSLPSHETVTGFSITPILAVVEEPFLARPEPGEVAEVFEVPLDHLLDIKNYHLESRIWLGQKRGYYAVPWGPYYIWGATARILYSMAKAMA